MFLEKAIQSILQQSYKNFEIIVVDDGSTDNSVKIIEKLRIIDQRIKAFYFKKNKGSTKAFDKAFLHCKGDLIYAFSSDDFLIDRNFFLYAVQKISEQPNIGGYSAKASVIDGETGRELWKMGGSEKKNGYLAPIDCIRMFFANQLFVPGISSIWKRNSVLEVGGYDHALGPQSDYFINHVLPMKHGMYLSNNVVAGARKIKTSYSHNVKDLVFFKRHALFEKKVKENLKDQALTKAQWHNWRKSTINARLDLELNSFIFNKIDETLNRVHEWERDALAPYIKEIVQIFENNAKPFNRWLQQQERQAHVIFNKIAGRIEDSGVEVPEAPALKNKLRSFLRRIRFLLKWN